MTSRATAIASRMIKNVNHQKQDRLNYSKGVPNLNDLKEGVPTIRQVGGDMIQFTKIDGAMYRTKLEQQAPSGVLTSGGNLSAPGYDSGWVAVSNGEDIDITHGLGTKLLLTQVYRKDSNDRIHNINSTYTDTVYSSDDIGVWLYMETQDKISVGLGNDYIYMTDNTSLGTTAIRISSGDLRIFVWTFGAQV